jgi:hypothetical protein
MHLDREAWRLLIGMAGVVVVTLGLLVVNLAWGQPHPVIY